MSPISADYVNVAERIRQFKETFPEGSLQSVGDPKFMLNGDRTYIVYCAAAYRTPDDPRPGIGWAWEPVPGPTPFTKDSELMNAETSAWGRAIVALGFETKKIASANEVRNRQAPATHAVVKDDDTREFQAPPSATEQMATKGEFKEIAELVAVLGRQFPTTDWLVEAQDYCKEVLDGELRSEPPGLNKAQINLLREFLENHQIQEYAETVGAA